MKAIFSLIFLAFGLAASSQSIFTVYFDFNRADIKEETRAKLDSFLSAEKENLGAFTIKLDGHCDFVGSNQYNDGLSERRVVSVKNYLLKHGVHSKNIINAKGHGEQQPLNQNQTEEDRQLNRRVEISLIKTERSADPLTEKPRSLKEQIADSSTVSGTQIALKNINFYGGMHRLLPESIPMLQELLDVMKSHPKLVIQIHGHICCQAHEEDGYDLETRMYNLSESRAKAIHDHLIANGIEAARVSYKGFGHSQPIYPYPEQNDEERTANRRVEIKIVSK